jgi:hypothetical protein
VADKLGWNWWEDLGRDDFLIKPSGSSNQNLFPFDPKLTVSQFPFDGAAPTR